MYFTKSLVGWEGDMTEVTVDLEKTEFSCFQVPFVVLIQNPWMMDVQLILVDMQTDRSISKQVFLISAHKLL